MIERRVKLAVYVEVKVAGDSEDAWWEKFQDVKRTIQQLKLPSGYVHSVVTDVITKEVKSPD